MCVHHVCMTEKAWVSAYSADEVSLTTIVSENNTISRTYKKGFSPWITNHCISAGSCNSPERRTSLLIYMTKIAREEQYTYAVPAPVY